MLVAVATLMVLAVVAPHRQPAKRAVLPATVKAHLYRASSLLIKHIHVNFACLSNWV